MIGALVGDIVGSRFEWNNIKQKEFELFTENSQATDDSMMTIAIAAAILEAGDDMDILSQCAIKWMRKIGRSEPAKGYGGGFRRWLLSSDPKPYNSWGNGAPMRVSPCAYVSDVLEEVLETSDRVTEVTHNHPEGMKGARATTEAIFLARMGKSKEEIRKAMEVYYNLDFTLDEIRDTYSFDESSQGTVPQAIEAFLESTDFEDAIRNAISIGGDSDTLAAITGSIAEAFYGVGGEFRKEVYKRFDEELIKVIEEFETKYERYKTEIKLANTKNYTVKK